MKDLKMGDGITFIAVRKLDLQEIPEAIKNFVEDFLEPRNIFGIECLVGAGADFKAPWIEMSEHEDPERYHRGLSQEEIDDCGVFTWFENHPELVFEYYWM